MDAHAFSVVIRWLHVAAMAIAFGGAGLMVLLAMARSQARAADLVHVATIYERAFWAAAGVLVMTGIGNLGVYGALLPSPDSAWGITLLAKLGLLVVLMLVSVPRTLAVAQLAALEDRGSPRTALLLARLYLATVAGLIAISALAVWLSHG